MWLWASVIRHMIELSFLGRPKICYTSICFLLMSGTHDPLCLFWQSSQCSFSWSWLSVYLIYSQLAKGFSIKALTECDHQPISFWAGELVMINFSDTWDVPCSFLGDKANIEFDAHSLAFLSESDLLFEDKFVIRRGRHFCGERSTCLF